MHSSNVNLGQFDDKVLQATADVTVPRLLLLPYSCASFAHLGPDDGPDDSPRGKMVSLNYELIYVKVKAL